MVTIDTTGESPLASNLGKIAAGIRNVFGMAFQLGTGDLYFADNAEDALPGNNFPPQADELNVLPAAQIGVTIPDYGFPSCYIQYFTGTQIGSGCVRPIAVFQPLPDTTSGHPSQGPAGLAFAPPNFPPGLNNGVFIGFSGGNSSRNPVVSEAVVLPTLFPPTVPTQPVSAP